MTDRELLEAAARAAGYRFDSTNPFEIAQEHKGGTNWIEWNPLTDDGDALRLAIKLKIQITPSTYNKDEFTAFRAAGGEAHEHWSTMQDEYAATRRAIVRAAAAMAG